MARLDSERKGSGKKCDSTKGRVFQGSGGDKMQSKGSGEKLGDKKQYCIC